METGLKSERILTDWRMKTTRARRAARDRRAFYSLDDGFAAPEAGSFFPLFFTPAKLAVISRASDNRQLLFVSFCHVAARLLDCGK